MKQFQNPMKIAFANIKNFADNKVNSVELSTSFLWKVRIYTVVVLMAFSLMFLLVY
jgi:hypothetical protein